MSESTTNENERDLSEVGGPGSDGISNDGWEYGFSYVDGEVEGYEYEDVLDEHGAYVIGENGFCRRRRKIPLSGK